MKIIFMGTPEFSVHALKALVAHHTVLGVFTQPPRPAGHGLKLQKSPVHLAAEQLNLPVYYPKTLRKEPGLTDFLNLAKDADVGIVCAYGLILPKAVLEAPRLGCINIHASLLPRWRGAAPIQRALLAGDHKSGITIMQMDEGLDTGDMLLKEEVEITNKTTYGDLHDTLAQTGAQLIMKALAKLPTPIKQPDSGITYAEKIQKEEAFLDFKNETAEMINRRIHAFNPYPGAYFFFSGERIKVFEAQVEDTSNGQPGEVLDNHLLIRCAVGAIRLHTLQRPGKKVLSAKEILNGFNLSTGTIL